LVFWAENAKNSPRTHTESELHDFGVFGKAMKNPTLFRKKKFNFLFISASRACPKQQKPKFGCKEF
jgi:hypothetical protein